MYEFAGDMFGLGVSARQSGNLVQGEGRVGVGRSVIFGETETQNSVLQVTTILAWS